MPKKILLVDDDNTDRSLVAIAIEANDVNVVACRNGAEALEYLQGNPAGLRVRHQ